MSFQRYCLAAHIAESCPKRDFKCKYCGFTSTYEEVCNKHWPACAKYPLHCPNKCGIGTVQRGSLEKHLNECPLQVECEFCHAGCEDKIQRRDLEVHMEKNLHKHLSLLSAFATEKIKSLSTEAAERNAEIKCLTTDVAEKEKQIIHLQSRVQNLENVALLPLPPVEFTLYRYSQYEDKFKWWEDVPTFYTCPMGHKVKIILFLGSSLYVKLQNVAGQFDSHLQWPLQCTLSLQLFDQMGEHHLKKTDEFKIGKGQDSGIIHSIKYGYNEIRNPKNGTQYLKEDCLHFRVDVKPKK